MFVFVLIFLLRVMFIKFLGLWLKKKTLKCFMMQAMQAMQAMKAM